mmetsp:Transcript_96266/g.167181  ORF Transcript_96266/g.167181 Transcript_96266/m.167181 type:complete len:430 (-) Transcript_96266:132-1421(-)
MSVASTSARSTPASTPALSTPVADVTQQCQPVWDVFVKDMVKAVRHEVKREARRGGQRTCMGLMDLHSKDKKWLESPSRGGISRKDYTVNEVEKGLAEMGCPHHQVNELNIATPRGLGEFKHYTAVVAWGPIGNSTPPGNGQAQRDGTARNTYESINSTLRGRGKIGRRRPSSAPAHGRRNEASSTQHKIAKGLSAYDDHLDSRMSLLETMHMVPRQSPKRLNKHTRESGYDQLAHEKRPASAPSGPVANLSENFSTSANVGRPHAYDDPVPATPTEVKVSVLHDMAAGSRHSSQRVKRATSAPHLHSATRAAAGRKRPGRPSQSATPPGRRGFAPAAKDHVDEFMTKSTQAPMSRTRPVNTHFDNQKSFEASLRSGLEAAGRGQLGKTRKAQMTSSGLKMPQKAALGMSNVSTSASTLSCVGHGLGPR